MMQEIMAQSFGYILLAGAVVGIVGTLLAGFYDARAVSRRARIKTAVRKLRKPAQPSVTVIVYSANDAGTVVDCLRSLRQSRYATYDVVVADNASQDGTRSAVRSFMRKHPRFNVRLYARNRWAPIDEVLQRAYQKSRKGEMVIVLEAAGRPPRSFLKEAVARFLVDPDLAGLSFGECVSAPLRVADVASEVGHAAWQVAMKSMSLWKIRRSRTGLNGIYRREQFSGRVKGYVRHEASLPLPVAGRRRTLVATSWQQAGLVALAVTALLFMTYAMVLAASLVSYVPLLSGWLLVTVGSLAVIWSDEGNDMMQKLQLTFSAASIYFLLWVSMVLFLFSQMTKGIVVLVEIVRSARMSRIRQRAIS